MTRFTRGSRRAGTWRIAAVLTAAGLIGVAAADHRASAAGPPVPCEGTITLVDLVPIGDPQVRPARTRTTYAFRAMHTFCPAPGQSVVVPQAGTAWFDLDADGTGTMRFTSTLEYQGDTLRGQGTGHVTATGIAGHVQAFGGTGALAGISGTGTFRSSGPASFDDVIDYIYP